MESPVLARVQNSTYHLDHFSGGLPAYLGPEFNDAEIESELSACGAVFAKLDESDMIEEVASALADEKAVGWMQGRMEFGPRALGGRPRRSTSG